MLKIFLINILLFLSCKENVKKVGPDNGSIVALSIVKRSDKDAQQVWSGEWEYIYNPNNNDVPEQLFTIDIINEGANVKAQYCAVANSGGKIDCENETIYNVKGKIDKGKVISDFYSFFGSSREKSIVELSIIGKNTMRWRILRKPKSEFYCPNECILKKNQIRVPTQNMKLLTTM